MPEFLTKDKEHWSVSPDMREIQKNDVEVKGAVSANVTNVHEDPLNKLICHYSEWHSLKKAVSWMKFKQLLQKLSTHRKLLTSQASDCSSTERKKQDDHKPNVEIQIHS